MKCAWEHGEGKGAKPVYLPALVRVKDRRVKIEVEPRQPAAFVWVMPGEGGFCIIRKELTLDV